MKEIKKPIYPIYIINKWSSRAANIYIGHKQSENFDCDWFLNEDKTISRSTTKYHKTFRSAIKALKEKFPNITRVRNSIYGTYGKKRRYIFIDKAPIPNKCKE